MIFNYVRSKLWDIPPLYTYGALCHEQGQEDEARAALESVRESFAAHNELRLYASALHDTGVFASRSGRDALADAYFRESRRLKAVVGDGRGVGQGGGFASHEGDGPATGLPENPDDFLALEIPGLPDEVQAELAAHHRLPSRVGPARRLLEAALFRQYRRLAHGMFVDQMLREKEIPAIIWWVHYCCMTKEGTGLKPELGSEEFLAFRRRIAQDVALRRVRRVRPEDFYDQEVVIFGGRVHCWEEGRINRQLAALGSSIRLLVINSDTARKHRVFERFVSRWSAPTDACRPTPMDGGFIVGRVGPWSAYCHASVSDFRQEFAVAPHIMRAGEGGFAEQNRAVCLPRPRSREDTNEYVEDITSFLILLHEYRHIKSGLQRAGLGGSLSSWRDVIREDICRLAASPCELDHIARKFGWIYRTGIDFDDVENLPAPPMNWEACQRIRIDEFPELREDVDDLLTRGLLKYDEANHLYCPMFQEHAPCRPSVA